MSAILTLEGTAGFGHEPALLEDLSAIGFRITSLGWNEKNPLTGSHVTGGGLTDAGREEAERMAKHKEALARTFEKQFAVPEDQSGLAAVALMCTLDEETLVRIENSGKSER